MRPPSMQREVQECGEPGEFLAPIQWEQYVLELVPLG